MENKKSGWISIRETYPKEQGNYYVKDCTTGDIGKTKYNGYDFLNDTENTITHWRPLADKEEVEREVDAMADEEDGEISQQDKESFHRTCKVFISLARKLNQTSISEANFVSQLGMSIFVNCLCNHVKKQYVSESFEKSVVKMREMIDSFLETNSDDDDDDE